MKAITNLKYGSPDILQLQEVDQPSPQENEVLIRIHATAVTAADTVARAGKPYIARLAFGLFKPKINILGTEFAGEVVAIGSRVTRFRRGDQVYAASGIKFGAYAEYLTLPEDGAIALKPENMSYAEAAGLAEGMLTALPFLRDEAKLQAGQHILINGASGSVGTAAVQLAKYFGATVTAVSSGRNAELLRSLGADEVIDYTKTDFTRSGRTYDVIFDAVGKSSYSRTKRALKPNGIYMTTVLNFRIFYDMLVASRFSNRKALIAFTGLRKQEEKVKDLDFLRALAEEGYLRAVISGHYRPDEIIEAHRHIETGRKRGNIVVSFTAAATNGTAEKSAAASSDHQR